MTADLEACRQALAKNAKKEREALAGTLRHWLCDRDFAGVRGDKALALLPESERAAWRTLWQEVETLRRKSTERSKK